MKKNTASKIALICAILLAILAAAIFMLYYPEAFVLLIFAIPIGALAWFIASLVLYIKAKRCGAPSLPTRRAMLVISSVLLACIAISLIALVIVFALAIAHM